MGEGPVRNRMGERLLARDFQQPNPSEYITLELDQEISLPSTSESISVKRVCTEGELRTFVRILANVSFSSSQREIEELFYQAYIREGLDENSDFSHYIASLDGNPIGCSSLLTVYDENQKPLFSDFWFASVLQEARRRGVWTAMASTLVQEALRRGAPRIVAFLTPERMAWGCCESLGFKRGTPIYFYYN